MTREELEHLDVDDFLLWRGELTVSDFRAILTERCEAQEAAETYWEAWQDAAVYWKEKIERLESRLDNSRSANGLRQRRLEAAIAERDRLRAALERYGRHESGPDGCRYSPCTCGLEEALKARP
jgi:hypothetical protein